MDKKKRRMQNSPRRPPSEPIVAETRPDKQSKTPHRSATPGKPKKDKKFRRSPNISQREKNDVEEREAIGDTYDGEFEGY
jgi:hypothetical protein